jgi:23S rRNA pseudouridine2605 synthase
MPEHPSAKPAAPKSEPVRLQKFLADCGVASRRAAEEVIRAGRVKVNGAVVTEMGIKVGPADTVAVDGRTVGRQERMVYVILNKPTGYITTARDEFGRRTVLDLVADVPERIYPVGRLDFDTSGLLLLTNDGDLTFRLTHPSHEVGKTYQAVIEGTPSEDKIKAFKAGLRIEDYTTAPAELRVRNSSVRTATVDITLHEGKNRQVRKMCEAIGHPVISLRRVAIGRLTLGNLPEGKWRSLTPGEMKLLE